MLKFIIFLATIIIVTLCININIDEPDIIPNVIEATQSNNIIFEDTNNLNGNIINNQNSDNLNTDKSKDIPSSKTENNTSKPKNSSNKQENGTFISKGIPDNIYKKMLGKSIPTEYKDKVDLKTLRYLQISYFGFDGKVYIGEMIVNAKLSNDVLEIFKELYNIKYPIEKIRLIDEYNADDNLSMSDNNTSCFCYRVVPGSTKLSNHAKRLCNRYKSIV